MNIMKNNKVLFVVGYPDIVDTVGGANTVFINFCNMLSSNGYIIYAICSNKVNVRPKQLCDEIIFVNLFHKYRFNTFSEAFNKLSSDITPDLFIFFASFLYIDAELSSKYKSIPRILMFHSRPDFYFTIDPNSEQKLESLYTNTTSQVLFDSYKKLLPDFIKNGNLITIPNGIKTQPKIIDLNIEHKKIIYLSRIDSWKGHEFLIKSFNKIARKYPDWKIDIYGQSQPDEYVEYLIDLTKKLKLNQQISFKGITNNPIKTFKEYDFCVFPSYFEGFPMGLAEAQSVGLPCIGLMGCSGVNELIINGYNGFLCEKKYKDFAIKMEKLILDKELRKTFSKNTYQNIKQYNSKIIYDKWLSLIADILNNNLCKKSEIKNNIPNIKLFPIEQIIKKNKSVKWYKYLFSVEKIYNENYRRKLIYILGIKISFTDKKNIDNLIFFRDPIDIRMGGPSGYCANLKSGLKNISKKNSIIFYEEDNSENIDFSYKLKKFLINLIPKKSIRHKYRDILNKNSNKIYKTLNKYNIKTITTHLVDDTLFIKEYLSKRKSNTKIITMSHSPQLPSNEIYDIEKYSNPQNAEKNLKINQEKEYRAFTSANAFIFPSEEATECYVKEADYFNNILNTKDIYYLNTGCQELHCDKSKAELREYYHINTPYVISYIGRHNEIKGYDILKTIAEKVLNKRTDVTFIIGGKTSETIKPLNHERWLELGIINPAEVLKISDIFILPNRQTYFDLILLEVLSMGVPVVASNTGGNKSVYKTTNCIDLFDNVDECVTKCLSLLNEPEEIKQKRIVEIRKSYLKHYTNEIFAMNYANLIEKICNDKNEEMSNV